MKQKDKILRKIREKEKKLKAIKEGTKLFQSENT